MLNARSYEYDDKAQLHERLPEFAEKIGKRSRYRDVKLDSFIISATPYEALWDRYGDTSWDLDRFVRAHILFPDQGENHDYIAAIIGSGDAN